MSKESVRYCTRNEGAKAMKTVTIIGSGQMGSALAFPLRDNNHEVRLVGTHLDHTIIEACRATARCEGR